MENNTVIKPVCQTQTMSVELIDDKTVNIFIDHGHDYKGDLLIEVDDMTYLALNWLDLQGYDVTKRKPEIAPCPNPECERRQAVYIEDSVVKSDDNCEYPYDFHNYYVLCDGCGYCGPEARTSEEAIRLHNLLCGKGE